MARLINDSGVLGDVEVDAKSVKDVSFDKLIEAIHVIQTNLGITGTTAREAESTIQGSFAAARAAASNFAIGLADDTQDIDVLLNNLIQSVDVAAGNLIPRVGKTFDSILYLVNDRMDEAADFATEKIVWAATEKAPRLISLTTETLGKVLMAVEGRRDDLSRAGITLFEKLFDGFEDTIELAVPLIEEFVPDLASGFIEYQGLMFETGGKIVMAAVRGVSAKRDQLSDTFERVLFDAIAFVDENAEVFTDAGIDIVTVLADGVVQGVPRLVSSLGKVTGAVANRKGDLRRAGASLFEELLDGFEDTVELMTPLVEEFVPDLADGFLKYYGLLFETGGKIVMAAVHGVSAKSEELSETVISVFKSGLSFVDVNAEDFATGALNIGTALVTAIGENLPDFTETGISILSKIGTALISEDAKIKLENGFSAVIAGAGNSLERIITEDHAELFLQAGGSIITKVGKGLCDHLPDLEDHASDLVASVSTYIGNYLPTLTSTGLEVVTALASSISDEKSLEKLSDSAEAVILGFTDAVEKLSDPQKTTQIVNAGFAVVDALGTAIIDSMPTLVTEVAPTILKNIFTALMDLRDLPRNTVKHLFDELQEKITDQDLLYNLTQSALELGEDLVDEIKDGLASFDPIEWGRDFIDGIVDGFLERYNRISNALSAIAQSALDFFGIEASPYSRYEYNPETKSVGTGGSFGGYTSNDVYNVTVNTAESDPEKISDYIMEKLESIKGRRRAVSGT